MKKTMFILFISLFISTSVFAGGSHNRNSYHQNNNNGWAVAAGVVLGATIANNTFNGNGIGAGFVAAPPMWNAAPAWNAGPVVWPQSRSFYVVPPPMRRVEILPPPVSWVQNRGVPPPMMWVVR